MAGYVRSRMFFFISTLVMLGAGAYISYRLLFARHLSPWMSAALTFFILLISQSISVMRFLITSAADVPFVWLRVGGYISALFTTVVSLIAVRDLFLILLWLGQRMMGAPETGVLAAWLNTPRVDICLLGGSVFTTAFFVWRTIKVPRIHEMEISIDALPRELDGLRLAQLSDLHMGSTFNALWLREVVERTNAMQPDFVLLTGDLVDGRPALLGKDMKPLGALKARYGVLIVAGNHEYYSGLMPWVEAWRRQGLTVLLNEHRRFTVNGVPLIIAGITDPSATRFPGQSLPDPVAAKEGAPRAFSILMAHQPKNAARHAALGYDLQVSGHTHGGQYVFMFPLVSWLNRGYRSGLYDVQGMKLYVSPGTGMWGYVPMRVGSSSEISILNLTCPRPAAGGRL